MSVLQHHNCLLPFSKAASCPPLPQINKASVSKYTTEEGSKVKVTCHLGHRLSQGFRELTFHCKDGAWTPNHENCKGAKH